MTMALLGRIGGVDFAVVPKLRTAIASKASITPTDAHTLVSGAALQQRPVDQEEDHDARATRRRPA